MPDRLGAAMAGPLLILTPTGRDAEGATLLLGREGIVCRTCSTVDALCASIGEDTGAVLVAVEALATANLYALSRDLTLQPPWSDLPFIVLTQIGAAARRSLIELKLPQALGNVVFLERPLNALNLVSAVRAALRARRRQRQVGAHLAEREQAATALAASETRLREANEMLEARVAERTAELMAAEAALRQAQKMEAVGQLTGGIAHDFNNMLQAISGNLEMMRRRAEQGRLDDTIRFAQNAHTTIGRASALTHRLLAFARQQSLQPRPLETDALVEDMAELIGRTVGPDITVELRLKDGIWTVLCDPSQLENTLLNLAINARDAMTRPLSEKACGSGAHAGDGRLIIGTANVRLERADVAGQEGAEPGEYVEISVSDTGSGMDEATRARAFEPFFTTKPLGQGTGLGLSQCYGFVRQSGGVIKLDSAPGRGTTVRLFLPRHLQAPTRKAEQPVQSGMTELVAAGETVLLVEDEASVRSVTAERLRELGYAVLEAEDGVAALTLLRSVSHVDLLVTDVGLPNGLNGRQVAEAARERRPDLPVLFVTGYAGTVLDDQLASGMAVITKPFELDILTKQVRKMLEIESPR